MSDLLKKRILPLILLLLLGGGVGFIIWKVYSRERPCDSNTNNCGGNGGNHNGTGTNGNNVNTLPTNGNSNTSTPTPSPTPDSSPTPTPTPPPTPTPEPPRDSATVKSLENEVLFPSPRPLFKDESRPVNGESKLSIRPDGEAQISLLNCQDLHFFSSKGSDGQISYAPSKASGLDRLITVFKGVLTSSSSNCTEAVRQVSAGDAWISPHGTWYSMAYFPDPGSDRSKDKLVAIVFEDCIGFGRVGERNSPPTSCTPSPFNQIATNKQIVLLSGKADGFEVGEPKDFPRRFEEIQNLYNAFNMQSWMPRVLELYDAASKGDGNKNNALFPIPNPVPSPATLNFGDTPIRRDGTEQKFIVKNPSGTKLNLVLHPPAIRNERGVTLEPESGQTNLLVYRIKNGNIADFVIVFDKECEDFLAECGVKVRYLPKTIDELKDTTLMIRHNADADGKFEVPLTGKATVGGTSPQTLATDQTSLKLSTTGIKFKSQRVNTENGLEKVTMTLDGPGSVTIGKISLKITDTANTGYYFVKTDNCSGKTLKNGGPDKDCTMEVAFNPRSLSSQSAKVRIPAEILLPNSTAPEAKIYEVDLEGAGFTLAPDPVCFGRGKTNSTENPKSFKEIKFDKPVSADVKIDSFKVVTDTASGTESKDFKVEVKNCGGSNQAEKCISVGFTPTNRKIRRAFLLIYYNGLKAPIAIPLNGVGKPHSSFWRFFYKNIARYKLEACPS